VGEACWVLGVMVMQEVRRIVRRKVVVVPFGSWELVWD
jgi:hypothetical protein